MHASDRSDLMICTVLISDDHLVYLVVVDASSINERFHHST